MEAIQAEIARRIAKLEALKDSDEAKRQRKREFAAIGKLKRHLAEATTASSSTTAAPSKRPRPDADLTARAPEGPPLAADDSLEYAEDRAPQKGSGKKATKQLVKGVNHKLALMATRKQLSQALKCFRGLTKRGVPGDVHTYTNIINCAVRCGELSLASKYYAELGARGLAPNVVTVTAMLKGHCEAGDVHGAKALLDKEMGCHRAIVPNLRTANTLLRGCVRAGCTSIAVATFASFRAWGIEPDESAVTAVAGLLCRTLQVNEAARLVAAHESASLPLGAAHVLLATASAVLGKWSACSEHLLKAETAAHAAEAKRAGALSCAKFDALRPGATGATGSLGASKAGGKGVLVDGFGNAVSAEQPTRQSVALFARHRDDELRGSVSALRAYLAKGSGYAAGYRSMLARALPLDPPFPSTDSGSADRGSSDRDSVVASAARRLAADFGLQNALAPGKGAVGPDAVAESLARVRDCLDGDGRIDFAALFGSGGFGGSEARDEPLPPVYLELGSGHGEWLVEQAKASLAASSSSPPLPSSSSSSSWSGSAVARWVGVELRHDRVVDTLFRGHLAGVASTLAVVGPADASVVLSRRLRPGSLDRLFVNHPEPPERTGSASQGRHLLTPAFFVAMADALRPGGTLTIVTDNLPYAQALAETADAGGWRDARFLYRTRDQLVKEEVGRVTLYVGQPGAECGHDAWSSSYFNRLWAKGHKIKRYTLFIHQTGVAQVTEVAADPSKGVAAPPPRAPDPDSYSD